jgi:hypothetical protein
LGGTRVLNLRRGVASLAALAIHVAIITIVIVNSRSQDPPSLIRDFVSTWILLPSAPATEASNSKPLPRAPLFIIDPIQIEPLKTESVPMPSADTSRAIDWTMEAQRTAAAITNVPKARELDPETDFRREQRPTPTHQAGDGYRDPYGNTVVWVNDRCYVVSESPALGTPDVFLRSRPTRTACVDQSAPEGELFKDLPAFKKHHPQQ